MGQLQLGPKMSNCNVQFNSSNMPDLVTVEKGMIQTVNFLQQQLPGVPMRSNQQLTRDKLRRLRKELVKKVGEKHIADVNVLDEPVNIVMEKFTGSARDFVKACAKDAKAIALAAED